MFEYKSENNALYHGCWTLRFKLEAALRQCYVENDVKDDGNILMNTRIRRPQRTIEFRHTSRTRHCPDYFIYEISPRVFFAPRLGVSVSIRTTLMCAKT